MKVVYIQDSKEGQINCNKRCPNGHADDKVQDKTVEEINKYKRSTCFLSDSNKGGKRLIYNKR